MRVTRTEVRRGAYADSIVLMRLQAALAELPGIDDAGVVMGTRANLDILRAGGLEPDEPDAIRGDDLVVVVAAADEERAAAAVGRIDELLKSRGPSSDDEIHARSLRQALRRLPDARWALISTPGRRAARVAREALERGLHVFLYSDNVPLAEEVGLKRAAAAAGRLVLGPDCGTAIIGGVGLGFANRVRRGPVGLVCASGTGLQAIASRVHELGSGVSQGIGTGGRDLHREVGAATALQGLDLLARDPETRVIALASKPPDPTVSAGLLGRAAELGKPVVVHLSGRPSPLPRIGSLHFARSLEETAEIAVRLAGDPQPAGHPGAAGGSTEGDTPRPDGARRYLRGLFAGGTLALEALHGLGPLLSPLVSNLAAPGVEAIRDPTDSRGHTLLDLGADDLTVGRLHPMIDPRLRIERLEREARDPEVAVILLDVVLGQGAEADPAATLGPVVARATADDGPAVVALVLGTDEDPQDRAATVERLTDAGAWVTHSLAEAVARAAALCTRPAAAPGEPVDLEALAPGFAAVNIGLPSFHEDLLSRGVSSVHVDWRPPAGGDERLLAILEKMRS